MKRYMLQSGTGALAVLLMSSYGTAGCSLGRGMEETGEGLGRQELALGSGDGGLDEDAGELESPPDPTQRGPYETAESEYRFPAAVDPDVRDSYATEVWAAVYRPKHLADRPHPVVVFLHGNHATCGTGANPRTDNDCRYSKDGVCNEGDVVVPNHLGYGYVAERLASWGYVAVSINANRGINCETGGEEDRGLNTARGRLILKHLQRLSEWNLHGGTPPSIGADLRGKLDLEQVGLVGHSRGGEGARAAYNLYRDKDSPWPSRIASPVRFRGIFEVAPVDGRQVRLFNADGTAWAVLLPMCDADVVDLEGIYPFDRMMQMRDESPAKLKASFLVWGANHNFYNTEWQISDSPGCTDHTPIFPQLIGSPEQRTTGIAGIMALMRANVGRDAKPSYNRMFDPIYDLPNVVTKITRVDRGYTDSPNASVTGIGEDFDQPTGTNTHGTTNDALGISIVHGWVRDAQPSQRAANISWKAASKETYLQTNWSAAGEGRDLRPYKTLDFRVSRQKSDLNPESPTNFSIQLVADDGSLSSVIPLDAHTDLRGPVGGPFTYHPILQTVRVPLSRFRGIDLTRVRGVRFTFDATTSGAINLANVRLSTLLGSTRPAVHASFEPESSSSNSNGTLVMVHSAGNAITSLRTIPQAGTASVIEIELQAGDRFPVRDALAVLQIGARAFTRGQHPNGDTHRFVFTIPLADFAALANGDDVSVHYGNRAASERWTFGPLDKARLDR